MAQEGQIMIELRNWKWTSGIFFAQAVAFLIIYFLSKEVLPAMIGAAILPIIANTSALPRVRGGGIRLIISTTACSLSAVLAVVSITSMLIPRPWGLLLVAVTFVAMLISTGVSAFYSQEVHCSRDWTANFFANFPLGVGFVVGGVILL